MFCVVILNYFNPFNNEFTQAINSFNKLKGWQKAAAVVAALAGAIFSSPILFIGSFAAFRWTVEHFNSHQVVESGSFKIAKVVEEVATAQGIAQTLPTEEETAAPIEDHEEIVENPAIERVVESGLIDDLTLTPEEFIQRLSWNALPENKRIIVTGSLILRNSEFASLPANLCSVLGNLDLSDSLGLTSLPDNLSVIGNLILQGCTGLTSVPAGISIGGGLYLRDCTGLTSLPDNLCLGGYLSLRMCTGLTSLPANLSVGGYLDIGLCTGLTSLPDDLLVRGAVVLVGCTGLTSLPNTITQWGLSFDGTIRDIFLSGAGLSDAVITRLRASEAPGMRFHFSQRASQPTQQFASIQQGLQFWANLAEEEQVPQLTFNEYANKVLDFLTRLTSTAEYKNTHTRSFLAKRVVDMFKKMSEDSEVKEEAVNSIYYATDTCDDRIISGFNEIELMIEIRNIENENFSEEDLKDLGRRFLLLEMVNEKAKEHVESLRFVDEIEVYLAFQIALADRFNLPTKTRNMIFRRCADITDAQIQEFGNQIEAACTDEKLNAYLETWSPWIKYKRKSNIPSYGQLPIDSETRVDDETICPISQDKPEKAVSYRGWIYDYEYFIGHYQANGNDPKTPSERIDISELKRISN